MEISIMLCLGLDMLISANLWSHYENDCSLDFQSFLLEELLELCITRGETN